MRSKVLVSLVLCVFVAGIACAENDLGQSKPKSVDAVCSINMANVSWDSMDDEVSGYDVYYKPISNQDFAKANSEPIIEPMYTVTELVSGTGYEFGVVAIYEDGSQSSMSDTATCTTS